MNPELLIFTPILFSVGILSTVGGGGVWVIVTIAATFFYDLPTSIALASLLGISVEIAKIAYFYKYVRWDVVGWFVLTAVPCAYVGGRLLFVVPEIIPRMVLAVLCLLFVVMRFFKFVPTIARRKENLLMFGALNGFLGGLAGNAGIIRMSALMSMGLSKEVFIGTHVMIATLMNLSKIGAYSPNIEWKPDFIILLLLSIPTLFLSVHLGKYLLRFVSAHLFENIQLVIILAGAIRLLFFA
jgi:uncharacterized membrane protein YfcA